MIKKFYLVGFLALMGLLPISAKLGHATKKVSVAQAKVGGASDVAPFYVDKNQGSSSIGSSEFDELIQNVAPSAMPIESFSNEKIVKGYDVYFDNEKQYSEDKDKGSTYDEKHRLVRKDYSNGDYERYVYSEDSEGRTIHVDKYEYKQQYKNMGMEDKEYLTQSKTYSYDHMVEGASEDNAYLVEDVSWAGNANATIKYTWFEPKQCFIRAFGQYSTASGDSGSRNVGVPQVTVNGNCYSCVWSNPQTNSKLFEYIENVDEGYHIYSKYDESTGKLVDGSKTVVEKQDGNVITTNYSYAANNDDSWVPVGKIVETENYGSPLVNDGMHREHTEYSYNTSNGQFEIDRKRTYDWLHKNPSILMERRYTYYTDGTTDMESTSDIVDGNGYWWNSMDNYYTDPYAFKDGRCVLYMEDDSSESGIYKDIFVFYDKDGKEQGRYRFNFLKKSDSFRRVTPLEIYKDGKWQYFEVTGDSYTLQLGDIYDYRVMDFDKEGYLVKFDEYEDNALRYTTLYTYTDNSCIEEVYGYDNGEKSLYDWYEYSIDSDGALISVSRYYADGEFLGGEKTKTLVTPEGVRYQYGWNSDANDWSEPYISVEDVTYTLNGVNTTISRSLENGQIVETQKNEQKQEENGDSWSVTYNKVDNEWKPVTKSVLEKAVAKPKFDVVMPMSEITGINSGYPITYVDVSYFYGGSSVQNSFKYNWDDTNNDWSVTEGQEYSFNVAGNTLNYATTTYSDNGSQSERVSYTRDADNRLVEYTLETENTDKGKSVNEAKAANATMNANVMPQSANTQSSSITKKFEYDEKDRLSSVTIITDHEEKYVLHYADEPTGIDLVKTPMSVQHVSIYGKTINVDGCKSLSLYSADGKLVAKSQSGSIEAPVSGLYIVAADGVKIKVIVK